jgi:hypothetical protein
MPSASWLPLAATSRTPALVNARSVRGDGQPWRSFTSTRAPAALAASASSRSTISGTSVSASPSSGSTANRCASTGLDTRSMALMVASARQLIASRGVISPRRIAARIWRGSTGPRSAGNRWSAIST